jgi:hypothetical protein
LYEVLSWLHRGFDHEKGSIMVRTLVSVAASAAMVALSTAAFAQQAGTAQEARAMLDKAVAALKADREVALAQFNKGEAGFLDHDLYPFCFRFNDGKGVAGPRFVPAGLDARTLKDPDGKEYGKEFEAAGQKPEGQITAVNYKAPKPGTTAPAFAKETFLTKAGDLVCGVGYYK